MNAINVPDTYSTYNLSLNYVLMQMWFSLLISNHIFNSSGTHTFLYDYINTKIYIINV